MQIEIVNETVIELLREMQTVLSGMQREIASLAAARVEQAKEIVVIKETYTTDEVAERVGLSPWTIRQWCNHGKIHALKIRGRGRKGEWRIPHGELLRLQGERTAPLTTRTIEQ